MKRYCVEIEGNVIKNPAYSEGEMVEEIEYAEPFVEITEEFYVQYKGSLPATFELDSEGNMTNITPLPRPELIPPQPSEIDILKAQNKALVDRQEFLEDVIAEMAMMVYD